MKSTTEAIEEIRAIWREAMADVDPLPTMARVLVILGPICMVMMLGGLLGWWDLGGSATKFDTTCWLVITALGTFSGIFVLRHHKK